MLKDNASIWTTDVVVPVSRLPELIDETKKDVEGSSLPCPFAGHAGDGKQSMPIYIMPTNKVFKRQFPFIHCV